MEFFEVLKGHWLMAEIEKSHDFINRIAGLVMVILSLGIFVAFFIIVRGGRYEEESLTVNGPYEVTFNGETFENVDLSKHDFPSLKKGDHVTYSFTMPDTIIDNAVLTLYFDHAAAKIYFDDKLVYEKGTKDSKMLGYGYVDVNLPVDYAGLRVLVDINAIENEGLSSLSQPVINNSVIKQHNFIIDTSLYLIIDIAIIMLCITIVLVAFIFSKIMPSLKHLAYFGMAFFLMGLYEMCSYNLISIFSDSLIFRGYLEYSSLYVGPFFLTVYFYKEFFSQESVRTKKMYRVILVLQGVFPVMAFILHFTDILHLPESLTACHVLLLTNVLTMLGVLIKQLIRKKNIHKYMVIGLILMILLAIFDMVRFNILIYFKREAMKGYVSYLLVGFFLFLIAMLIDFFVSQRKKIYKTAHAEAMAKLAHTDMMTDLANRRGCEKAFDEIREDDGRFGIICIDINFLKLTNDRYGHQEGDKLLVDFAHILSEACTDETYTVGRMGGDEFTVIMPGAEVASVEALIHNIEEKRDRINVDRKPLPISFACGYCLSDDAAINELNDAGDLVEKVYHIADERMYENKKRMKARRDDLVDITQSEYMININDKVSE